MRTFFLYKKVSKGVRFMGWDLLVAGGSTGIWWLFFQTICPAQANVPGRHFPKYHETKMRQKWTHVSYPTECIRTPMLLCQQPWLLDASQRPGEWRNLPEAFFPRDIERNWNLSGRRIDGKIERVLLSASHWGWLLSPLSRGDLGKCNWIIWWSFFFWRKSFWTMT